MAKMQMQSNGTDLFFQGKALNPEHYDPNNFTHEAYSEQISALVDAGYVSLAHGDAVDGHAKTVMLDHPLPASLAAAEEIAAINQSFGFKGTFYVEHDSPFYNLDSEEAHEILKSIQEAGQKIGINITPRHDDRTLMTPEELGAKLEEVKAVFYAAGTMPDVYVLDVTNMEQEGHDPDQFKDLAGMVSATSNNVLPDGKARAYLSDSNGMHLYGKDVYDHIDADDQHLKIVVHPQWRSPEPSLPYDRVMDWMGGSQEAAELYNEHVLENVHKSRVIAGDGFDPSIDYVVRALIEGPKQGYDFPDP